MLLGEHVYARNQPIIPVSCELNEPIVEWTDNKTLLTGAFPDKFLFGQGVPTRLLCWECRIFECQKNGQINRHVCVGPTCCRHVGRHVGDTTKNGVGQGTENVALTCRVRICWQHVGGKLAYQDLTLTHLQRQYAITPLRQYASMPVRQYASTPVRQYASTPVRHYAIMPLRQYVSTSVRQYASTTVRQ